MPLLLVMIGVVVLASAIRGTTVQLGQQFVQDLKGSAGNVGYVYWVSSIIAIGSVGYYSPAQKFSRAFMFLIITGMVLANRGIFAKIGEALKHPVETKPDTTTKTAMNNPLTSGMDALATGVEALQVAETALMFLV